MPVEPEHPNILLVMTDQHMRGRSVVEVRILPGNHTEATRNRPGHGVVPIVAPQPDSAVHQQKDPTSERRRVFHNSISLRSVQELLRSS